MSIISKILTNKRVKSFLWRTLMMVVAVILSQVMDNIDLLAPYVNATTITVLGLVLGELSKAVNNRISGLRLPSYNL